MAKLNKFRPAERLSFQNEIHSSELKKCYTILQRRDTMKHALVYKVSTFQTPTIVPLKYAQAISMRLFRIATNA